VRHYVSLIKIHLIQLYLPQHVQRKLFDIWRHMLRTRGQHFAANTDDNGSFFCRRVCAPTFSVVQRELARELKEGRLTGADVLLEMQRQAFHLRYETDEVKFEYKNFLMACYNLLYNPCATERAYYASAARTFRKFMQYDVNFDMSLSFDELQHSLAAENPDCSLKQCEERAKSIFDAFELDQKDTISWQEYHLYIWSTRTLVAVDANQVLLHHLHL
jgi:hypothetical protein